jgi:hypothetical protein
MVNLGDIVIKLGRHPDTRQSCHRRQGLDEFRARRAREEAELEGKDTVTFSGGADGAQGRSRRSPRF